jgi:DNA/RNA endonuclease G (NUC1)
MNPAPLIRKIDRGLGDAGAAVAVIVFGGLIAAVVILASMTAEPKTVGGVRAGGQPRPAVSPDRLDLWGFPTPPRYERQFALGPPGPSKLAAWSLQCLSRDRLAGEVPTARRFATDWTLPRECRVGPSNYEGGEWDRGHLVPLADCRGPKAVEASSKLCNVAPMHPRLNRGPWATLEKHVRELADRPATRVWVVTLPLWMPCDGPAQGTPSDATVYLKTLGRDHVWIPTHFAKAALVEVQGRRHARAWLLRNGPDQAAEDLEGCRVSVDLVEHWSGLDLFGALNAMEQDEIECALGAEDRPN